MRLDAGQPGAGRALRRDRRRPGFTLVETLISMALTSILMSVCVGVILLSTKSLPTREDATESSLAGAAALQRLAMDLQYATAITDLRTSGITFEVHDRGHGASGPAETITYAWSGTAGSPLTRAYNDNPAVNQVAAVTTFQIDADTQDTAVLALRIRLTAQGGDSAHVQVRLLNSPEDQTP
jgi:prepilin-type N-terminal cleavage/methylation domain-containing protein